MAKYPGWDKLNEKQKKLAMERWREREGKSTPTPVGSAKERAHRAWLAKEVAPGVTNRDLLQSTGAATRLKYGETQRELREAQQQNRLQANRSQAWYRQYQQAIAQAGQAQQANTQQAVQGVQAIQQGLDASSREAWAGQQAAMAADAAQRGATVNPVLADQAHNASNVRNALTGSYGAMLLSQGTNTRNALSDRGLNARQQGLEQQRQFLDTGSKLGKQRVGLAREKGDYRVNYRQQVIANAFDQALKSALTRAQIGETTADTQKTRAEVTAQQIENKFLAKYGYKPSSQSPKDAAALAYFRKHGYWPPTGPPKPAKEDEPAKTDPKSGPGSLTPATEQKRISQVRTIRSMFQEGVIVKDGYGVVQRRIKPGDIEGVRSYLLAERLMDPLAVSIGLSLYRNNGKLDRKGVKNAHLYGIHVGGNFAIAKPKKTTSPPPANTGGTGTGAGGSIGSQFG